MLYNTHNCKKCLLLFKAGYFLNITSVVIIITKTNKPNHSGLSPNDKLWTIVLLIYIFGADHMTTACAQGTNWSSCTHDQSPATLVHITTIYNT